MGKWLKVLPIHLSEKAGTIGPGDGAIPIHQVKLQPRVLDKTPLNDIKRHQHAASIINGCGCLFGYFHPVWITNSKEATWVIFPSPVLLFGFLEVSLLAKGGFAIYCYLTYLHFPLASNATTDPCDTSSLSNPLSSFLTF